MQGISQITELDLQGRVVFMRLDLNVPLKDGVITSDARIQAALPTIKYALDEGARLVVASHMGRPKGKRNPAFSLEVVGMKLSELLEIDVIFPGDNIGDSVKGAIQKELRPGGLMLLENLRYDARETKNDSVFSKKLAEAMDIYINDAFGASHREHASIVGMTSHFRERAAGFLLAKEVKALTHLLEEPKRPFVAIVGGAKVADKVGIMDSLLKRVDTICIGGAMAYTFLKAQGFSVGDSRFESDKLKVAADILRRAEVRGVKILLPKDHIVASEFDTDAKPTVITEAAIPDGKMGLDIGPMTKNAYVDVISEAKSIFWNGPMGVFEWDSFSAGTMAVAEAVADSSAYSVVGGGDSVAAIEKAGITDKISHVSTGGGASLEFLQNGSLPGLEALKS